MTTPRPDQRHQPGHAGAAGSRSGSGDTAAALGFPGIPAASLNLQSAQILRQGVGAPVFFTFPAASRIWAVSLSIAVASDSTFPVVPAGGTTAAGSVFTVGTVLSGVILAVCETSMTAPSQHAEKQSDKSIPGLAVVQGDSLQLSVNGGTVIPGLYQRASAIVLYSTP